MSESRSPYRRAVSLAAVALLVVACSVADPATSTAPDPPAEPDPADAPTGPADAPTVPPLHPEVDDWDATTVTLTTLDGEVVRVAARVAVTPEQRGRGLMHVPEVPAGAGMLFLFDTDREGGFWMLNTLVALDIAFIAADGDVRAVLTMEPCTQDPCPVYDPEVVYRAALEVPAGAFEAHGVGVGAQATWTDPVGLG